MYIFSNLSQIQISGLIALVVASPLLIVSIRNLLLSIASKQWPKVKGIIQDITDLGAEYKFKLKYEFVVNGKTYFSNRIIFSSSNTYNSHLAREFESKYLQGQIVDVFYNPNNPNQAVLEPGRNKGIKVGIALLIAFIALAGLALFDQELFLYYLNTLMQISN